MPNIAMRKFFEMMAAQGLMLTYDDVRLRTLSSDVRPTEADVRTHFSRRVRLNIPIVSSPMDTVTTADMAIAMAEAGGLGIIHRGLSPSAQANEVAQVKNRLNARIESPFTFHESDTLATVLETRKEKKIPYHTFPVVDGSGKMVGILSRLVFRLHNNTSKTLRDIMIPLSKIKTCGTDCSMQEAYEFMIENQLQPALPLLNEDGTLAGMYAPTDLTRTRDASASNYNTDEAGHLCVGAAVGSGEGALERAKLLASKKCDVFHIDTAHGDSTDVIVTIQKLKSLYPHIDVVAGNVSSGASAARLAEAGADGVLVGQGPGSICTTRVVTGVGVPQVSAVEECVRALEGSGVPVCADGGINNSGDMTIALAIGASSTMLGRLLAGTDEAPGETRFLDGRLVKDYRGMGSLGAMKDSKSAREKYRQDDLMTGKVVPEGIEGIVPYKGSVHKVLEQYVGGIKSGMGYNGARTLADLSAVAQIFRITNAGLTESHPHGVTMTAHAPNYHGRG